MAEKTVYQPEDGNAEVSKPTPDESPVPEIQLEMNHHHAVARDVSRIQSELDQERREAAEKERQRLAAQREVSRFD